MSGRHTGTAGTRRRSFLLLGVATVLGVWFGVSAPEVSPVAAPAPVAAAQPADGAATGTPEPVTPETVAPAPAPVTPVPAPGQRGPQRGGGR